MLGQTQRGSTRPRSAGEEIKTNKRKKKPGKKGNKQTPARQPPSATLTKPCLPISLHPPRFAPAGVHEMGLVRRCRSQTEKIFGRQSRRRCCPTMFPSASPSILPPSLPPSSSYSSSSSFHPSCHLAVRRSPKSLSGAVGSGSEAATQEAKLVTQNGKSRISFSKLAPSTPRT